METYGAHAILSNLIKPNGISWDPSDFSNQIPSNPMESYGAMGF